MRNKMVVSVGLLAMLLFGNCSMSQVHATEVKTTKTTKTQETKTQEETQTETSTEKETEQEAEGLSEEQLAEYYKDSVFVGDSIMVGFRNYCAKQENSYLNKIQFLAVGSYSAFNAAKPVSGDNVHPLYKGRKYQIWDALPRMGAKRLFILLGMNDISILGLEGARDQYKEVIQKVEEACPGIEIHIMSATYTLKNAGKGKLNNKNLAQYNVLLQEMAEENGWGYLDVADAVSDGNGNLAEEYCSDGFVHLSGSAYAVWDTVLRDYAYAQQEETETQTETETETGTMSGAVTKTGKDMTKKETKEQGNVRNK